MDRNYLMNIPKSLKYRKIKSKVKQIYSIKSKENNSHMNK